MKDAGFSATLKSAKLIARKNSDKPDTILRRVKFELVKNFEASDAEWLGETAMTGRKAMQARDMKKIVLPIDGYHAKAMLSGIGGNAEITDCSGVQAAAVVKGKDDDEHEEITYVFEAFPDAGLMTFLAMSVGCGIDCSFAKLQMEIT
jgi:hypothetical protein